MVDEKEEKKKKKEQKRKKMLDSYYCQKWKFQKLLRCLFIFFYFFFNYWSTTPSQFLKSCGLPEEL